MPPIRSAAMQCPLCREQVSDENQLQVHYLMSCSGYVEEPSTNEHRRGSRSRNLTTNVQFRWLKSKPTLAREVFLISSLAGSVKLLWNELEECFVSDITRVPKGRYACQLVVDNDTMSTEDFDISDQSRVIDVMVSEASLLDGSSEINSGNGGHVSPPSQSVVNHSDQNVRATSVETKRVLAGWQGTQKGTLYEELVRHQILHGDPLDGLESDEREKHSSNSRLRDSTLPHTARDTNDLQQFLQPSITTDNDHETVVNDGIDDAMNTSNEDPPENGEATSEERLSSSYDSEPAGPSVSVSSNDDLEARPVVLGSNDQNDDQEQNGARDRTPGQSVEDHREVTSGDEIIPEDNDHNVVPGGENHEEIEDDRDHAHVRQEIQGVHEGITDYQEEVPEAPEALSEIPEEVSEAHDEQPETHEEMPQAHEEVPETTEQVPEATELVSETREEVPNDHGGGDDGNSREHETFQNEDAPLQHARLQLRDNPTPVPDAGGNEPLQIDNRPPEQRERPTGDVNPDNPPTRVSFTPPLSGREPVGGNERSSPFNIRTASVDDFFVPSPPLHTESTRDFAGLTERVRTRVSDRRSGLESRDSYSLPSDAHRVGTTRHSPPGSYFRDQDIRHPPLYTSPSRPFSSLSHESSVISPLVSPRDAESVTSTVRHGPNGGASLDNGGTIPRSMQAFTTSSQGLQDRQTPTGSVHTSPNSVQPTGLQPFSKEKIRELLDSLKQPLKRKNGHSPDSALTSGQRPDISETRALQTRLADRDEYIKKLKAKNAAYEKEIVKLRASELELTKELSVAQASKEAVKEQEDILGQLTQALSTKEMEYSNLERKMLEQKRTNRLLQTEMETAKKLHHTKVQELRRVNESLTEEVTKLRQDSLLRSPVSMDRYKKLLDEFLESRAVNESLQDQVKLLDKEKRDLKRKLQKMTAEVEVLKSLNTSSYRNSYSGTATDRALESIPDYGSSSVVPNGYLGTSPSARILASYQSQGGESTRQDRTFLGNYVLRRDDQNGEPRSTITRNDRNDTIKRYDGGSLSSSNLTLESYPGDFTTSSRRRKASIDETLSSDVSDVDLSRYRYTRSFSSDAITSSILQNNGVSESGRGHQRVTFGNRQDQVDGVDYRRNDRRRRERPHSYHSGSVENLPGTVSAASRPRSSPTPQSSNFAVRGYHMTYSPTSSGSSDVLQSSGGSSPIKSKPFAPSAPQELDNGMKVLVTRACGKIGRGKVKYIGTLPTKADTVYLGLELDKEDGKHDGEFNGKRFFKCKQKRGIFVPFSKVVMAYT